jgi:hypothetical protein
MTGRYYGKGHTANFYRPSIIEDDTEVPDEDCYKDVDADELALEDEDGDEIDPDYYDQMVRTHPHKIRRLLDKFARSPEKISPHTKKVLAVIKERMEEIHGDTRSYFEQQRQEAMDALD